MPTRHPIAYEIGPEKIEEGSRWLTVKLKNVGDEPLTELGVQLHSMDEYCITITGEEKYVESLAPDEEVEIPYRVSEVTGWTYVTIGGQKDEERFGWESSGVMIRIDESPAELVSVFALPALYPSPGESLRCGATVRRLEPSVESLRLEFWMQQPTGDAKKLATLGNLQIPFGDEKDYTAEITPEQGGEYIVHAYLYDGEERIGHAIDTVYVGQAEPQPLEQPELPPGE